MKKSITLECDAEYSLNGTLFYKHCNNYHYNNYSNKKPYHRKLLNQFGDFLWGGYDVKDIQTVIPLTEELDLVKDYLTIEQMRFGGRLKVHYDIDDVAMMIPVLSLLPLVENAVIHGIQSNPKGGNIRIYVKQLGKIVKIGVMDNGVGIDAERIPNLISGEEVSKGVGLYNISIRLNQLYQTSLCIRNIEGGGLNVYMILPYTVGIGEER